MLRYKHSISYPLLAVTAAASRSASVENEARPTDSCRLTDVQAKASHEVDAPSPTNVSCGQGSVAVPAEHLTAMNNPATQHASEDQHFSEARQAAEATSLNPVRHSCKASYTVTTAAGNCFWGAATLQVWQLLS